MFFPLVVRGIQSGKCRSLSSALGSSAGDIAERRHDFCAASAARDLQTNQPFRCFSRPVGSCPACGEKHDCYGWERQLTDGSFATRMVGAAIVRTSAGGAARRLSGRTRCAGEVSSRRTISAGYFLTRGSPVGCMHLHRVLLPDVPALLWRHERGPERVRKGGLACGVRDEAVHNLAG